MHWSAILQQSAGLLNDQVRAVYDDEVLLPYLNLAMSELQEIFELNNIPMTNESSIVINVPAGTTVIGYDTEPGPVLPVDLVEIQSLWESLEEQNTWTPVTKKEFLTAYIVGNVTPVSAFGVWAWLDQEIHLLESVQNNDLRLDYIKNLFTELTLGQIELTNKIRNTDLYFQFRTAALAAEFIEENVTRSQGLNIQGAASLQRSLGISIKSKQSIAVRRRPFRAAYKQRRSLV